MPAVVRTPQAQADLEAILETLEADNPRGAGRFAASVDRKCAALGNFPELGRAREDIAAGLRSTLVGRYVLFYRLTEGVVVVVRILDGRRNLGRIMDEGE